MKPSVENFIRERRLARRRALKTPMRIRVWKSAAPEQQGESLNVSASGIYFATESDLRQGETVEVLFEMPQEITGEPPAEWRCTGHVVRVESAASAGSPVGVAVRFDCYEVARSTAVETHELGGPPTREIALWGR